VTEGVYELLVFLGLIGHPSPYLWPVDIFLERARNESVVDRCELYQVGIHCGGSGGASAQFYECGYPDDPVDALCERIEVAP
jgi:hypothetical protein